MGNENTKQIADFVHRQVAIDKAQSFAVEAPAGSGKTGLLTQRYLALLTTVENPESVLAITFTNKAASEMLERVIHALQSAEAGEAGGDAHEQKTLELAHEVLLRDRKEGWNLLNNSARMRIMTFDKLSAMLAGLYPVLSEMGGPSAVEENAVPTYRRAIYRLLDEINGTDPEREVIRDSLATVFRYAENRLDQLERVLVDMLGKREQWLEYAYDLDHSADSQAEHILRALIESRLTAADAILDDTIKTEVVRALALRANAGEEKVAWAAGLSSWPVPVADELETWRALATFLTTTSDKLRSRFTKADGFPPKEEATEIMKALVGHFGELPDRDALEAVLTDIRVLPAATYPEAVAEHRDAVKVTLALVSGLLRAQFIEEGVVDFSEVAQRAIKAMDNEGATGAGAVMERMDYAVRHILVDEFQDTSTSQVKLIRLLTSGWSDGDGRTLFLVGDPQQSIYGFREADVSLFQAVLQDEAFGEIPVRCLRLQSNFRSDTSLVAWVNSACARFFPRTADLFAGAVPYQESVAERDYSDQDCGVHVHPFLGEAYVPEARKVAEVCRELLDTHPDETVAILTRSRSGVRTIARTLKAAGIDFSCRDIDPLATTDAVRDILALTKALWHPADRLAWIGLMRAPFVGLSWADVTAICRGGSGVILRDRLAKPKEVSGLSGEGARRISRLNACLDRVESDTALSRSLPRLVNAVWRDLGGPACVTEAEAVDVETVLELLEDSTTGGQLTSLEEFEASLDRLYATPEAGRVQILTMHAAKGLEFDSVILPGLGRTSGGAKSDLLAFRHLPAGLLIAPNPGRGQEDGSDAQRLYKYVNRLSREAERFEAQRVLYVALTRAKKRLHLMVQASEGASGEVKAASSSFAAMLWPAIAPAYDGYDPSCQVDDTRDVIEIPRAPRLDLEWQHPGFAGMYIPMEDHAANPSEKVVSDRETIEISLGQRFDQLVGVMTHKFFERLTKDGTASQFKGPSDDDRKAVAAGFRHLGLPAPQVEDAVERVFALTERALASSDGAWILGAHDEAYSELELSGWIGAQWSGGILDRVFRDSDEWWVFDYKTGGMGLAGDEMDRFIARSVDDYRGQVEQYAELVSRRFSCGDNLRKGLFFPAFGKLVEL